VFVVVVALCPLLFINLSIWVSFYYYY
jgi:hypothetical protein